MVAPQIIIANKDRAVVVWPRVHDYVLSVMMTSAAGSSGGTRAPAKGEAPQKGAATQAQGQCLRQHDKQLSTMCNHVSEGS